MEIMPSSAVAPADGSLLLNLTSMWAWDAVLGNWYFWAPSLVNSNGLAAYLASKRYLDFADIPGSPAQTLQTVTGFWVNLPRQ